jgi:hypothetical protein
MIVTNQRIEADGVVIFFKFYNGQVNSHKFPRSTTVAEIISWWNEREDFFKKSEEEERKAMEEQLNQLYGNSLHEDIL